MRIEARFRCLFVCLLCVNLSLGIVCASASDIEQYQEDLSLSISTLNEDITLSFAFSNVSGLFDASTLTSDPSFIMMMAAAQKANESYTLAISSFFNATLVTLAEAKAKADAVTSDLSNIFGASIPFKSNSTVAGLRTFAYELDDYPAQNLENIFLSYIPFQGFAELINQGLNYTLVSFYLFPETLYPNFEGPLIWTIQATISCEYYLDISPGHEYELSVRSLLNYPHSIMASPFSSASRISLSFIEDTKTMKVLFLETSPQMSKQETPLGQYKLTTFTAELSSGSSIEDFSIHFKIVSPGYVDPTTIAIAVGAAIMVVAVLGIIGFVVKKKHRIKEEKNIFGKH